MPVDQKGDREPRRLAYALGFAVNLMLLLIVHAYEIWLPSTRGVVTEAWPAVLWAIDLSIAIQLAGNALLFLTHPRPLRAAVDLVEIAASWVAMSACLAVYPFEFSLLAGGLDVVARVSMILVLFALAIAFLVNVVKLLLSPFSHDDAHAHH